MAAGLLLAVAAFLVAPALPGAGGLANAATLVSNLGKSDDGNVSAPYRQQRAQGFTTGSHPLGYKLTSIDLSVHDAPDDWDETSTFLNAGADSFSGYTPYGDLITNLTNPATRSAGTKRFAVPSGRNLILDRNATLYVVSRLDGVVDQNPAHVAID